MKYTIEDTLNYINSLTEEQQELLKDEGMAKLDKLQFPNQNYGRRQTTTYHFPNGYGYSYWLSDNTGAYHGELYALEGDQKTIEEQDNLLQAQCWIRAHEIMNMPKHVSAEEKKLQTEKDTIKHLKALLYEALEYIHSEKIYRNAYSGPDQRLDEEADSLMQEIKKQFTEEEEKEAQIAYMEKYV